MKVNLRIFLPMLSEVLGRKEVEVEFIGETINDLIDHLITKYGKKVMQALYDNEGRLDPVIQVLLNGETWINRDQLGTVLQDDDEVVLMMMMGGG
jgi:MoaD family protein